MTATWCPQHDAPIRADGTLFCTGAPGGCAWGHALPSLTCIRTGSSEDLFVVPVTFPSGVRWEPTDYRPIDQAAYRAFAGRRGPNTGETS